MHLVLSHSCLDLVPRGISYTPDLQHWNGLLSVGENGAESIPCPSVQLAEEEERSDLEENGIVLILPEYERQVRASSHVCL